MEDDHHPSLPSNYVSVVHLQKQNLTGGTSQLAPVTNGENECKFRQNDHKVWEPKVRVLDRTTTLNELNFEELSLNEGKVCIRSAGEMNAVGVLKVSIIVIRFGSRQTVTWYGLKKEI